MFVSCDCLCVVRNVLRLCHAIVLAHCAMCGCIVFGFATGSVPEHFLQTARESVSPSHMWW